VVSGLEAGRMSWERHVAYMGGFKNVLASFLLYTKGCAGCWVEYEKGLGYFSEISDWVMGWITKEL